LISVDIGHLNHHRVTTLKLGSRRTVAVGQEQLDGANLLVDIDFAELALACADTAEFLD
jgi:hypothetical protein